MRIAAVVVTYNRKELLSDCLTALFNQTRRLDEIIVIDNASRDGTEQLIKEKFSDVTYVKLAQNTGGAGGFHKGLKLAYEKGYDWIWVMDDDALAMHDALQKLVDGAKWLPADKIGALVSNVVWSQEEAERRAPEAKPEMVNHAMFVGWLAPRSALERAGLPREDFFIYWDDVEYSERLTSNGLNLYRISNSCVVHKDWTAQPTKSINILRLKINRPIYQDWKSYYLFRNMILTNKMQHHYRKLLKAAFWNVPTELIIRLLMKDSGKIKFILKATIDGLANKAGRRVSPGAK